jgi:hypothetical protein
MTLAQYQTDALATAQPEAFSLEYLIPMIVGETGELFGHRAKGFWHGWDADVLQTELVAEYGDIAWGTAVLLYTQEVHEISATLQASSHRWAGFKVDPWQQLLDNASSLHLMYSETQLQWLPTTAQQMWQTLERNSEAITGAPFAEVLANNIDKLASRAARGVLQGKGDHR